MFFLFLTPNLRLTAQNTGNFQPPEYHATNLDIENGLLRQAWYGGLLKDKKGLMWFISSHGEISRFDGNRFTQLQPFGNEYGSGFTAGHSAVEDSLNNIWIGSFNGLIRFDIQADSFTLVEKALKNAETRVKILPFWATREKIFCFHNNEIVTYDVKDYQMTRLMSLSGVPEFERLDIRLHCAVYEKTSNSVWVLLSKEEGLIQFSLDNHSIQFYRRDIQPLPFDPTKHNDAEAMKFDPLLNCIWINSHDGLSRFNLSTRQFQKITLPGSLFGPDYNRFVGIDIDRNGQVWFAGSTGIFIYDPKTDSIRLPFNDSSLGKNVAEANLKIYCDPNGLVWTSYWASRGIFKLVPAKRVVKNYNARPDTPDSLSTIHVFTIIPVRDSILLVGTGDGMNVFDPLSGKFKTYREKDFSGLSGKAIMPFAVDPTGKKFWVNAGPKDNIYSVDMQTRVCKKIQFIDSLGRFAEFTNVFQYLTQPFKEGYIFFDEKLGLLYFHRDSLVAHQIGIISNSVIAKIVIVGDSLMFLHTPLLGEGNTSAAFRNGRWQKINHKTNSLHWTNIIPDKNDNSFWISSGNTINHYDKDFNLIRTFPRSSLNPGTWIFAMIKSPDGNLWFSDDRRQINFLDVKKGIYYSLSSIDGYRRQDYGLFNAISVALKGELYFSGNSLSSIPNNIMRISTVKFDYPGSNVNLESVTVNGTRHRMDDRGDNNFSTTLSYDQNNIVIKTGAIDYYSQGQSNIRYRFAGPDSAWHYSPYYSTINLEKLPSAKYTIELQASNATGEYKGPTTTLFFNIHPAFWQTWWFRLPVTLAIIGTGYILLRKNIRQKYRKRIERSEKERQIAELKQKSAELEMQALRSQMNPHFIFNSLNSINRFILQNNRLQASEFLTKFSRLIRLILQNSQAPYITMESELESLGLYLELEALRFDYRFAYKISVDELVDVSTLLVPPLMIQPYVENAIWHGLMHKKEKGQLDIEVSQEGKYVYVRVADNGVGRKQAAVLASKSATKHKSMGLQITEHRIAMMHTENGVESPVSINDLITPEGVAAGTEVIIKIPEMYD